MTTDNKDVMEMTTAEEAALYQKLNDGYGEGRDEINQLIGQIQMAEAFSKMTDVVSLQKLQYIKEHKLYKALKGRIVDIDGEKRPMVGSFDEFCLLIGTHKNTVNERLQNANQFGIEAAETFERIGVSTKTLRLARKLPEDEQAIVAEYTSKPEVTKEDVQQLINDLDEKHQKVLDDKESELANKSKEIDSLKANLNANRDLYSKAQQESEALRIKLEEKRLKPNDYSQLTKDIEEIAKKAALRVVEAGMQMSDLALQLNTKLMECNNPVQEAAFERALEIAIPQAHTAFFEALQRAAALFDEFDHSMGNFANQPKANWELIKQLATPVNAE
ncbi:hypothetical protein DS2_10312 [Catenovulum agarivorans DS-2]|uniref:Uncharacterized protein n=1 Tax=Catenovulum agarivorans DS-2 TaxID=1328313 RepID=W7QD44_9ALTE|nr:hypothetical protein [Catenovulum agarivorans]EWH09836.1 hypothetical protein DS2_10312 [Catenovulum agarivorans DS-2]